MTQSSSTVARRVALTTPNSDHDTGLCSPGVGVFRPALPEGVAVVGGQVLGKLEVLARTIAIVVPEGVAGRLVWANRHSLAQEVAYGAPLAVVAALDSETTGRAHAETEGLPAGAWVFEAPMDGQLYLRPSPDVPAFVNVGDLVQPGQTVALVEVMKFFYPLRFERPDAMRLHAVRAQDARPVESGASVFVFVPA